MTEAIFEKKIRDFIREGINDKLYSVPADKFWENLRLAGTTLWLDTGDMDEAMEVWSDEMEALTTNNTLINKVIQKGVYDSFIPQTRDLLESLSFKKKVMEIAFILNARHGLRLTKRFGGFVSVELHTATANSIDDIVNYGLRYRDICPEKFIIKVPYTASGLIGARILKEKGVRINFTLGFSARHNVLTTAVARPDYLNVFLGRIGAYIADNNLGDGSGAGEKTVIETQKHVKAVSSGLGHDTKLIAASLRHHDQLEALAGVDVFTIPPPVGAAGRKELTGNFTSQLQSDYKPGISADMPKEGLNKFWELDKNLIALSEHIGNNLPGSGDDLEKLMREGGFEDMFPILSDSEKEKIASDGKIPVHSTWREKIHKGILAPDTLLNLAGLASFTADQGALDRRIESFIK